MKPKTTSIVAIQASAEGEPPETFSVHDDASANWVLRKVVEARAYAKRVKAWADSELKRAASEEEFFLRMYGRQLEDWARSQIKSRRRKSLRLPAGTIGFRIAPISLQVRDEQKLIAWCRSALPEALKIQTHVLKQQVKEHVVSTGECPDGAEVVSGGEKFYVR
jgi:hypothetical protein